MAEAPSGQGKAGSEEPTREIKEAFDLFDGDKDGQIGPHDLKVALNSLGFEFNRSEIERLIMEVDPNNTGKIDFQNFADLIRSKMAEREIIDQIQMAFDMIDDDHTGKVSFRNLKRVARELGENLSDQEIREMINEADNDDDGEICFDEFVALVRGASFS
jgi:Ca2+-binding EF-hand superfamily protein